MIASFLSAGFLPALLATYVPFLYPLPGAWDYWYLLLLPLCIAVAVVYKSIKCASMRQVPREATTITLWILFGMAAAGAVLVGIVTLAGR